MMHLHTKNQVGGSCGSGVFDVDGRTYIHTDIHTYIQTFFQLIGIPSIAILHMAVWKLKMSLLLILANSPLGYRIDSIVRQGIVYFIDQHIADSFSSRNSVSRPLNFHASRSRRL